MIEIVVTQEDIDGATPGTTNCVVARALLRANPGCRVKCGFRYAYVWRDSVQEQYRLDDAGYALVEAFVRGAKVRPTTVRAELLPVGLGVS